MIYIQTCACIIVFQLQSGNTTRERPFLIRVIGRVKQIVLHKRTTPILGKRNEDPIGLLKQLSKTKNRLACQSGDRAWHTLYTYLHNPITCVMGAHLTRVRPHARTSPTWSKISCFVRLNSDGLHMWSKQEMLTTIDANVKSLTEAVGEFPGIVLSTCETWSFTTL